MIGAVILSVGCIQFIIVWFYAMYQLAINDDTSKSLAKLMFLSLGIALSSLLIGGILGINHI